TFEAWKFVPPFEKVNGVVPPLAFAVIDPLKSPGAQVGFVDVSVSVSAAGFVKVVVAVAVAPVASLTVIVKVPAARPVNTFEVWNVTPSFEKVNGAVPPLAVAVIDPVDPPKHNGFVLASDSESAVAAVSVIVL